MTDISKLTAQQASILASLAEELQQYPKKRGHKRRFIPPEVKTRIGKAIKQLPKHIPATVPANILGLSPSRIRLWAQGKGIGALGGNKTSKVEKKKQVAYTCKTTPSTGFGFKDMQSVQATLWDAATAKPGQKASHLLKALSEVSEAVSRELS